MGFISIVDALLPILGAFVGLGTIARVYFLTWSSGHFPADATTPPISLLGCNSPEKEAYQLGFALTGVILLICLERWRRVLLKPLSVFGLVTPLIMMLGGYLAGFGVIGQGVVTLEEDLLENLKLGKRPQSQSVIHQRMALIFFLGAAAHCYSTAYYIIASKRAASTTQDSNDPTRNSRKAKACIFGPWSIRLKLVCALVSLLSFPISQVLHPARTGSLNKRNFNIAGLAQYIAVASYILFFASYALDFGKIQRSMGTTAGGKKVKAS